MVKSKKLEKLKCPKCHRANTIRVDTVHDQDEVYIRVKPVDVCPCRAATVVAIELRTIVIPDEVHAAACKYAEGQQQREKKSNFENEIDKIIETVDFEKVPKC